LADLFRFQTWLGAGALIGFILVCLHYLPSLDRDLMNRPRLTDFTLRATAGKLRVLRTMDEYVDQTNWIMTDMPMYAFRVRRPVPPDVATVWSFFGCSCATTSNRSPGSINFLIPKFID
jgi:hypothetical protein